MLHLQIAFYSNDSSLFRSLPDAHRRPRPLPARRIDHHPHALEHLPRLSRHLGRDIWIKRDDLTPLALGGNKARKLEYLGADALALGADVLVTAGAIQSNHVRQTAALAARQGLGCLALLENPLGTNEDNYLGNGNRLLLDLFGSEVEAVANLDNADELLQASAERLRSAGRRPYVVPIGGSNALGALGYVRAGLELAEQMHGAGEDFAAVALRPAAPGPTAAWRWRWRMPGRAAGWSGSRYRGTTGDTAAQGRGAAAAHRRAARRPGSSGFAGRTVGPVFRPALR